MEQGNEGLLLAAAGRIAAVEEITAVNTEQPWGRGGGSRRGWVRWHRWRRAAPLQPSAFGLALSALSMLACGSD